MLLYITISNTIQFFGRNFVCDKLTIKNIKMLGTCLTSTSFVSNKRPNKQVAKVLERMRKVVQCVLRHTKQSSNVNPIIGTYKKSK